MRWQWQRQALRLRARPRDWWLASLDCGGSAELCTQLAAGAAVLGRSPSKALAGAWLRMLARCCSFPGHYVLFCWTLCVLLGWACSSC